MADRGKHTVLSGATRLLLGSGDVIAAAIGLGLAAQRRSLLAAKGISEQITPRVASIASPLIPSSVATGARRRIEYWSVRGQAERLRARDEAAAAARRLIRAVTAVVLDEVDVEAVVSRVDVDQIAARIDIDAIVARLDLVALTEGVLDEIDLGKLVRESGGSMTAETIDAFRLQNMHADRFVDRIADRLLRRGDRPTSEQA
jgi:hypothetical protein